MATTNVTTIQPRPLSLTVESIPSYGQLMGTIPPRLMADSGFNGELCQFALNCLAHNIEYIIAYVVKDLRPDDDVSEESLKLLREFVADTDQAREFVVSYPGINSAICAAIYEGRLVEYYRLFTDTLCSSMMDRRFSFLHKPRTWTEVFESEWEKWQVRRIG